MENQFDGQSWKRRSIQIEKPKELDAKMATKDDGGLSFFYKLVLVLSFLCIIGAFAFFILSDPLSSLV